MENYTGYTFCAFNYLRFKRYREKSKNCRVYGMSWFPCLSYIQLECLLNLLYRWPFQSRISVSLYQYLLFTCIDKVLALYRSFFNLHEFQVSENEIPTLVLIVNEQENGKKESSTNQIHKVLWYYWLFCNLCLVQVCNFSIIIADVSTNENLQAMYQSLNIHIVDGFQNCMD